MDTAQRDRHQQAIEQWRAQNPIKVFADEHGLTASAISQEIKVSDFAVRRHMRGQTKPSEAVLAQYALLLNVPAADLQAQLMAWLDQYPSMSSLPQ